MVPSFELFFYWFLKTMAKILLSVFAVWIFKELTMGICTCTRHSGESRLSGKVICITGATSGIGYFTAVELIKQEAKVILGCTSIEKGERVAKEISSSLNLPFPNEFVVPLCINLSSKESVKTFAKNLMGLTNRLDVLVNNAGMAGDLGASYQGYKPKRCVTEDGFEKIMATNYLGHVYLTFLLRDLLKKTGTKENPSMVINLGSVGHLMGSLSLDSMDLNSDVKAYSAENQYCTSKLALMHFTKILSRKFISENWNTVCASVNPGLVRTNIFNGSSKLVSAMILMSSFILGKNGLQGAQTTIHLAMMGKKSFNGKYFADCREEKILKSRQIGREDIESKLWSITTDILKIQF